MRLLVIAVLVAACSSNDVGREAKADSVKVVSVVAGYTQWRDKMCACKDAACAKAVLKDSAAWNEQMYQDQRNAKIRVVDTDITEVTRQMTDCAAEKLQLGEHAN